MIFLDVEDLLHIAERAIGAAPEVRDRGLLDSAVARPQASAFGEDAYVSIHEKAAAFLHSIARNHALVDGNKRLALAATIGFLGVNGWRLTLDNESAYRLIVDIAVGDLDDVGTIAKALEDGTEPSD